MRCLNGDGDERRELRPTLWTQLTKRSQTMHRSKRNYPIQALTPRLKSIKSSHNEWKQAAMQQQALANKFHDNRWTKKNDKYESWTTSKCVPIKRRWKRTLKRCLVRRWSCWSGRFETTAKVRNWNDRLTGEAATMRDSMLISATGHFRICVIGVRFMKDR